MSNHSCIERKEKTAETKTDLLFSFAKSVSMLQSQQGRDWPTHNENG